MENVVSLTGAAIESQRRAAFVQTLAQAFDKYAHDYGFEPDALVFTLAGITKPSQIGWDMQGVSQSGPSSVLALAAMHVAAEAQNSQQGLPPLAKTDHT